MSTVVVYHLNTQSGQEVQVDSAACVLAFSGGRYRRGQIDVYSGAKIGCPFYSLCIRLLVICSTTSVLHPTISLITASFILCSAIFYLGSNPFHTVVPC